MATTSSVSNSKRQKVSANVSGVDRISTLPDSIISRILSLLPTKYAVATSVLSTKWRFRWTSISNLDFDDSLPLLYPEKSSADKQQKQRITSNDEMKKLSFVRFVNRVLLLLNPQCICKFRFTCSNELVCDRFHVAKWISAALARNIRELDLNVSRLPSIEIPRILFTCKTIVVLKLSGASMIFNIPANSVCFPNLKILHLIYVKYAIDDSPSKLSEDSVCVLNIKIMHPVPFKYTNEESDCMHFFSCPVLEELIIQTTAENIVPNLGVYAPGLRNLQYNEDVSLVFPTYDKCKLQINAPELEYLNLVIEHEVEEILVEILSSLLKADIAFRYNEIKFSPSHCNGVLELLKGVCNVKLLSLSCCTLDVSCYSLNITFCGDPPLKANYVNALTMDMMLEIDRFYITLRDSTHIPTSGYSLFSILCEHIKEKSLALASDFVAPVFHNLTRLELKFSSSDWHLIPALLESSYNLEYLACNEVSSYGFGESTWTQPSHVPKCLLSCFKSVQIYLRKYPSTDELSLLSYILKNAKVLEKMTIRTSWNLKERFKLIQKIAMFPRGSQTCQVDFA